MMRISKNVRTSYNQDGAVLMDIHGGSMLTLNPVGSIIWRELCDGCPPVQIAEHLAASFSIPAPQALADVNEFVQELEAQHLILPPAPDNIRMNIGRSPQGLFCNLFGKRNSHASRERDPE
jgi:hypothetical protein